MRKRVRQLVAGLVFLIFSLQVCCFGVQTLMAAQKGNVYDEAELLTEQETDALAQKIAAWGKTTGWEIYAVTTAESGGKSAQAYADDFFDSHSAEKEDGIAALIDMDNREIYLSTCGEAIRYLTDERLDYILDDAYGAISGGRYAECLEIMLESAAQYYEKGIPGDQYNYDGETGEISVHRSITLLEVLIAAGIALLVFAAVYVGILGKYRLKFGNYEYDFRRFSSLELRHSTDTLVNNVVTHRRIPQNTGGNSHGSSGRSTTHHSSSGRSHGGGGRRF